MLSSLAAAAVTLFFYMTGIYVLALLLKDNSIADIAYGIGFILAAGTVFVRTFSGHPRQYILMTMILVWGLRLAIHIYLRNRGRGEDFRYRQWRESWGHLFLIRSYLQVFLLQGAVILVVATPAVAGMTAPGPSPGLLGFAGIGLWGFGFFFEAVGDWQLRRFKKEPGSKGRVMTRGLWKYSRHPNYFGEATLWWGLYLVALGSAGNWWTVISPLTINFLLLKVSGIPMLEKRYEGDPEFEAYKARTSAFFPWFPRSNGPGR